MSVRSQQNPKKLKLSTRQSKQLCPHTTRNTTMTAEYPLSGLMKAPENDTLELLKREIYGTDKPLKSIRQRIGELVPEDRSNLVSIAKIVLAFQQARVTSDRVTDIDYASLIERLYKGLKPELKVLLADVLDEIEPVKVVPKKEAKPSGRSIYEDDRYFPKKPLPKFDLPIQPPFKDTPEPKAKPSPTLPPEPTQQTSFLARLEDSESSGRSDAEITLEDGRKFVGKLQFGEARLKDYQKATGTKFSQEEFRGNLALQDRVASWHLDDIDKAIDALGEDAKAYDRDGLRAVAHLSGKTGMRKFVQSKGEYNPQDQLGTSAQDYYNKFSGAA